MERVTQKVLYGALFTVALPFALVAWAHASRDMIDVRSVQSIWLGVTAIAGGALAMIAGMLALWRRGGGLPMNAFPPPRFVQTGIYALVPHPIYGGFFLISVGVAVAMGSQSGLWLVSPVVALASTALVLGYEMPDLRQRFGAQMFSPWLPPRTDARPSTVERVRAYFTTLLPWLAAYQAVVAIGEPPDAISTVLPFEANLPVWQFAELVYASTYVVVCLTPLVVRSRSDLRDFVLRGLVAMGLIFPLYLLLPFVSPPRPFVVTSGFGELLRLERAMDGAVAAWPSFHVVWALLAAAALGRDERWRRVLWFAWAALVAISCAMTGMHSILDIVAGFAAFAIIVKMPRVWTGILRMAERVANSWREWRIGPLRIINHGAYAGAGTFVGMCIISALVPNSRWLLISIYVVSTVGAALWAQWVEGSPALLRPLGFYGGMLGAILGAMTAFPLGIELWTALCAICVAAPFIQAIGRLRCLVQGCCHGRAAQSVPGIRYTHSQSRVCRLTGLGGRPVHATPVYSILWNCVVAAVLLRLVSLHCTTAMICGVYLVLGGMGRFVEEAYRGEPQTVTLAGLRMYQWLAVASVIAGAAITTVSDTPASPMFSLNALDIPAAATCGFAAWFVTGMDFPESSRRFARLT